MHETHSNGCGPTTTATLEEQVITVVADTLGRDVEGIEPGQSLISQLGANSIDLVDLGFRLEQTFAIELDTNRLIDPATHPPGTDELTVALLVELVRQARDNARPTK
jgi:acyl carrier protein